MSKPRLTAEQQRFCENRIRHPEWNAGFCYLQSYPKCQSEKAAAVEASRNLKKPKLQKYIQELRDNVDEPLGIIRRRILKEEACLAFFDPIDMVDPESSKILEVAAMPEHARRALRGITVTEDVLQGFEGVASQGGQTVEVIRRKVKYRFHDKGAALQRIERIRGMYEIDNKQKPAERETRVERWVAVPSDRELTMVEWCKQAEELMVWQEERDAKREIADGHEQAQSA